MSRVGNHAERVQNIYFAYVVYLRAITKLAPYLETYKWCTGNMEDKSIIQVEIKKQTCTYKTVYMCIYLWIFRKTWIVCSKKLFHALQHLMKILCLLIHLQWYDIMTVFFTYPVISKCVLKTRSIASQRRI